MIVPFTNMGTSVQDLISFPFSNRTFEEQMRVIKEGPLRLTIDETLNDDSKISVLVRFEERACIKSQWVTACPVRKSFFCWPCLLFNTTECVWNKQGLNNLSCFDGDIHDHDISFEHIQAQLDLKLFYDQNIKRLNLEFELNMKQRTEAAKRHQEAIKVLINAVYTCIAKEKIPRIGDDYSPQLTTEDCLKSLSLLQNYDIRTIKETSDAIGLVNQSPKLIGDITDAMSGVLRLAIKKEVHMSTYVSLILTEHSDVSNRSLISTVLRYLKNGKVCERFTGFTNISGNRVASGAYKHILSVLNDFELSDRFLAYYLDGGVLPMNELSDLIKILQQNYPYCFFTPWHFHMVDYVLQQSLMCFTECSRFFKTMNAIINYFYKSSIRYKSLNDFMFHRRPELVLKPNWFNGSAVSMYRKDFIAYFDHVLANTKKWDYDDISNAFGFCQYLKEFQSVFLLHTFTTIFDLMFPFQTVLKGNRPDNIFATYHHDILKRDLISLRNIGFAPLWSRIVKEGAVGPAKSTVFRELFTRIINHAIEGIEIRFDHLNKLEFCHMLNHDKYMTNCTYRAVYITKLIGAHGAFFDKNVVLNELDVLQKNEASFPSNSVEALYDFFLKTGMENALPNLFKLAELRLTLPIGKADTVSKHKEITKWSYFQQDTVPGDMRLLCVEMNLLRTLKKKATFHDEVIAALQEISEVVKLV